MDEIGNMGKVDDSLMHCKCSLCNHNSRELCIHGNCYCCNLEDIFSILSQHEFESPQSRLPFCNSNSKKMGNEKKWCGIIMQKQMSSI